MRFYTLIHICENENSIHNNSFVRDFDAQINLYFTCAKQLHHSLHIQGIDLVILTNDKNFLLKLNSEKYHIEIVQLDFTLKVPSGVKFYSAHFKIEVYKFLASVSEEYVGLIDCDIVCLNPIPESFKNIVKHRIPLYYDITEQVTPAYSETRIIADKQKINSLESVGLWAGGEFIAGPPNFFAALYFETNKVKLNYFKNVATLHHQSDEVLTSVAIENMIIKDNLQILNAGSFNIIARYWSPKPLHVQKPVNAYIEHFLLHLPSDKKFIANIRNRQLKREAFFEKYQKHVFLSRVIEKNLKSFKPYVIKLRKKIPFVNLLLGKFSNF